MASLVSVARTNALLAPIGTVLAIGASILVARWLGPENYVDYATVLSILSWLVLLGETGCNVGLQRYLAEAGVAHARRRLYDVLGWRRWGIVLLLALGLTAFGPIWAAHVPLPADRWGYWTFAIIGVLAGVMLQGQLATSALFASFRHVRAITVANAMTILRAAALGAVCVYFSEPLALLAALLVVACLEASLLHASAVKVFDDERSPLPSGMANAAQRHGLVGLVDKVSTALTGSSFLILALASFHGRAEIAVFAIATDMLQKLLAILLLPITNLVLPMLNDSRNDRERFVRQVERLGGGVVIISALAAGGVAAGIPVGLPLLFGNAYAGAVPIALLWLAPMFIEAVTRMIWGAALLTLDQRRWLLWFNVASGALSLLVVFAVAQAELLVVVIVIGLFRVTMSAVVLRRAAKSGLLPAGSRPLRIAMVAATALALSCIGQFALAEAAPLWRLVVGLCLYGITIAAALHFLPLIPDRSHEALRQLAGRYGPLFARLVPRYQTQE
jgi:O-antigen/teichoic acid export membrane protein